MDPRPSASSEGLTGIRASTDVVDTQAVSRDLWPRRLIELRDAKGAPAPAQVFWPQTDDEVVRVVRAARAAKRALVPFGAGSGVCGGISPGASAWVLDTKRLDHIIDIDVERRRVVVEAGVLGDRLERALNHKGLTLGHFPSSLYCSTVGGWVATRSAGQLSSRFGKIEDMVLELQGVDGRGERIRASVDDEATGPGLLQLLIGSEGSLCIVTRVTLRCVPLSTHRWLRGFRFVDLGQGLSSMRAALQAGEAPSVLRLYDPLDTGLAGAVQPPEKPEPDRVVAGGIARAGLEDSGPHDDGRHDEPTLFDSLAARVDELALFARPQATRRVVGEILGRPQLANALLDRWKVQPKLIVGVEGGGDEVAARAASLRTTFQASGATDLGDAPGARWLAHRHRISYRMSRAFAAGGWVDTFEVACGWDKALAVWRDVREALRDVAVVMCHFSHAYADGVSLYFTFAGGGTGVDGPRSALSRYDLAWERAMTTVRRHGVALSHHHGVGRQKARSLKRSDGERAVLRAVKAALDPDNILNPGVLGLPESP
jgi:alkyldihydroxyacetonephosphate synthase